MRRGMAVILAIVLIFLSISATAASFDQALIDDAKQSLALMSYGEYQKALKRLNLKKSVSEQDLSDFIDNNFPDLYDISVQTDVGVGYKKGSAWYVAVPIEAPDYDSVLTLVLRCKNAQQFDAMKVMAWYDIEDQINSADQVVWNEEYQPTELFALPDA